MRIAAQASLFTSIYHNTARHCVLIVESKCGKRDYWSFQSTNIVERVDNPKYTVMFAKERIVYSSDDKDEAVRKIAKVLSKAHNDYHATKYNCCDWVKDVLDRAGISWSNPNLPPF